MSLDPADPRPREATERTCVIVQPCFFPWRGQFDLMSRAHTVVFLDTVQFSRNTWYNRNRIMTANGPVWITVPVRSTGDLATPIRDIRVASDKPWQRKMGETVRQAYARYPHAQPYLDDLLAFLAEPWESLSELAQQSVRWCFARLGREPAFVRASDMELASHSPIGRLVEICTQLGAARYLSGPAAKDYIIDDSEFASAGVTLEWMTYDYPNYPQLRASDTPLSVLDLLFNTGAEAPRYIFKQTP